MINCNNLSKIEKEALIDLLWMNQSVHKVSGMSKIRIYRKKAPNNESSILLLNRKEYKEHAFCNNISMLKIKFKEFSKENLLIRKLIEKEIVEQWIKERANYLKNHKKEKIEKIEDIIEHNDYLIFISREQSFIQNSFWSKFYDDLWFEIGTGKTR